MRIRKLRDSVDQAVTYEGKIKDKLEISSSPDEIGELERGLHTVMKRLKEYNHYLEAMASRLTHEMRTPLSMVKTSLDNVSLSKNQNEQNVYIKRAYKGTQRLEVILRQLNEATSLEQAFCQADAEIFDINQLIRNQIDTYCQVWPKISISFSSNFNVLRIKGMPDLISQAMDKLINN